MSVDLSTWTLITVGLYSNSADLAADGVVHIIVTADYTGSYNDLFDVIDSALGGTWDQVTPWNNVGAPGPRQMESDFSKTS
jgi:hypothetical protein